MERPFRAYKGEDPYIFVSYAHADAALVYPELVRLKAHGFNIWYDEGIAPGQTWRDEVALALTQCRVFLYFVTPRSIASSNCLKELNFSLSRERKVLSVHLEQTQLTAGLELSLSDRQAILRADHSESAYQQKLTDALRSLLPDAARQPTVPEQQPVTTNDKSIAILPLVNRSNDPGQRIPVRRDLGRTHLGTGQPEGAACRIADIVVRVQEPECRSGAHGQQVACRSRTERQYPEIRQPRSDHLSVESRRRRHQPLVETLRPRTARHIRTAGGRRTPGNQRTQDRTRGRPVGSASRRRNGKREGVRGLSPGIARRAYRHARDARTGSRALQRGDQTRPCIRARLLVAVLLLLAAHRRWAAASGDGAERRGCARQSPRCGIRAAGSVDQGPQRPHPGESTQPAHAGAGSVTENPQSGFRVAAVRVHPIRRVSDRRGLQSRRMRLLRILLVADATRSQRHLDSAAVSVTPHTAGPLRQSNRNDDAARHGRARDHLQPAPANTNWPRRSLPRKKARRSISISSTFTSGGASWRPRRNTTETPTPTISSRSITTGFCFCSARSNPASITWRKTSPVAHTPPFIAPTSARSSLGPC